MTPIYIPCKDPEKWRGFLAEPDKQWRSAYSARTLAYSWTEANGFPVEVDNVLRASLPFQDVELLLAIPEYQVPLPGGTRPSQNDVWVLARARRALVSIAVEGKVKEPFDKLVRDWRVGSSPGKTHRLEYLARILALPTEQLDEIHYQLLHRTASALIEAERYNAAHAMMLVHSFSQAREHFDAYRQLVACFGRDAVPETVVSVEPRAGISLHFAWVTGDPKYLTR
jgi:hypothetical protein